MIYICPKCKKSDEVVTRPDESKYCLDCGLNLTTNMKPWLVKEFSRYKLGNSEYKYNKNRDKRFKTEAGALKYFSEVDSGIGGDTSFSPRNRVSTRSN